MVITSWDNVSHIATLYSIITIFLHEIEGCIEMSFVVTYARRCFMMHHEFNPFAVCIVIQSLDIKVRIRRNKIENIVFPAVSPVLPTYIPSFNENLLESISGCKVNVFLYVFCVRGMPSIRFCLAPINLIKLYRWELIRVIPTTFAYNHLPPYAAILHRMNPTGILKLTRFVEI